MKKLILFTVVIALAVASVAVWRNRYGTAAKNTPQHPTTAVVEARNINFTVSAAGDIGPDDMVSVRPEVNGRIAKLPVDIGDDVKKGDLLCALDDTDLQTERSSRLTDIGGAQLQLDQAKRNYERSKQLYAVNLVSQELFQDTETAYELAKNALERAQKALNQVDDQLSKTRIVAPFDCTVLTRPVSIGQAVSGSGGYNSGTEIMTIANLTEMIITAHLNQADVIQVKSGQKVDVQVEAVPGLKLVGTVERVAPQATVKNNIKGFDTQIRLTDIDRRVRPGMTATMIIPVFSGSDVLSIPIAAVFTDEGEHYAYVRTGENEYVMRPIQIGVADFDYAQVMSGLSSGEVVSLVRPESPVIIKPATSDTRRESAPSAQLANSLPGAVSNSVPVAQSTATNNPARGAL